MPGFNKLNTRFALCLQIDSLRFIVTLAAVMLIGGLLELMVLIGGG